MTVEKFIHKTQYDSFGQMIFRLDDKGNISSQLIDLRGWASIRNSFETEEEAQSFQDEIGEFIAEAINDKIESEKEEVNLINFSDVDERNKISNSKEELIYSDGSSKEFDVELIPTREEAIKKALVATSEALKRKNALSKLGRFCTDFSRHRNYEIEYYLDEFLSERTGVIYKIKEVCPFNRFSWYSEEEII